VPEHLWRELWILVAILALSLILAELTGYPFLVAALGFGLYIALNLRNLIQLYNWAIGRRDDVPDARGLWGDVLDRIRAITRETAHREDRLTEMLERFQSASAATPDAMVIVSGHHEIEWANTASQRLLGISTPRDTGVRLTNLIRPPQFADFLDRGDFTDALELASPVDSQRSVALRIIPFGSDQKLIIARDTTHFANLENMRRNFVANISHELRTPLTVLTGFIETLRDMNRPAGPELDQHLGTMHDQAQRMTRLVDDLLTLSRLETTPALRHEQVVDVSGMLPALRETAEHLGHDKHHRIVIDDDPGLKLLANEDEVRSAFSNLVNNAVRYSPADSEIRLIWHRIDGQPVFAVQDQGEGIAAQHLPHLTERFYRVDTARSRASGGTGLGLSIVKHILLRHEGRLVIDSEPGQGSRFACVFPAARAIAKS